MKARSQKRERFLKIFGAKRKREQWLREFRLKSALDHIHEFPAAPKYPNWLLGLLNRAAPIAFNLGKGWIECNGVGSIHPKLNMLSYRPRNHQSGCTALQGGISLPHIKRAKLI